ncbi:carbohydrate kinase family protein [Thermosulfurimonas marina]|uniref:Carbohydrate kinase family protein n=1 Tax=Thermosulfurimonas marina TaxID=2047767 RepID=A0A6H1WSW6_9BACT|nr:carbohydrate kinase family protein [Thermosulfurimonas marina]QJA06244.1 carbohydrate kinase family protein [Thermosulfurimonas marina]
MKFLLSGALNLDLFYEVPSLKEIGLGGLEVAPGGEVALSLEAFEALEERLSQIGKRVAHCGGGSAANTAFALARFGFEVAFLGACGRDEAGEHVLAELAEFGVDLSGVRREGTTGRALIVLDSRRDRFIAVCPGTCEKALADFDPEPSGDWLHLSSLVSEEGLAFHLRLVRRFFGRRSLDPGEIYAARGRTLRPLLARVTTLFITESELFKLGFSPEELWGLGVREIFLKHGARGAARLSPEGEIFLPAAKAEEVVDNTGAGDFFDAGVLAGLALGLSPEAALRLGLRVAAASLRDYGRRGCPGREEFLNWVRELKEDAA